MSGQIVRGAWKDIVVPPGATWGDAVADLRLSELQLHVLGNRRNQPQIVDGEKWLLVQFLLPKLQGSQLTLSKLLLLVGDKQLISLHRGELAPEVVDQIMMRAHHLDSPSGVLACMADAVTDLYGPILTAIDDVVDTTEETIMKSPNEEQLHQLFVYKKLLAKLRRVVISTASVLSALSDGRYKMVDSEFAPYLRDSYDYMWRSHELVDSIRDLLTSALDTYLSMVSNRMNDVMKRLTLVATVFMPISFLAGVGGMNFTQMPFNSDMAFVLLVAATIVVPLGMLAYFRNKHWI